MQHILVIHYSQSGQLTEIVNNVCASLRSSDEITITDYVVEMETPFPFPWTKDKFFGIFPETFMQIPEPVKPMPDEVLSKTYDLIILGYPIWYLTPALPISSFLDTEQAKKVFKNTPVITVIGCRNMWIMAQEKMKRKLQSLQANLVGNIVLADRHINHISVITISHWMFSGVKSRLWGVFPKPGVAQEDIDQAVKFGPVIKTHLKSLNFSTLQAKLLEQGAVTIKPFLITVDKRANLIFSKWAKLIRSKSEKNTTKRYKWAKIFNYYLLFAIWIIAPIVFILFLLTYLFNLHKIKRDKAYYSSVVLKETV